jgi:hypothetical protein
MKPQTPTESEITTEILRYLHVRGITAWRMNSRVVKMPGKDGADRLVRFGGVKGMSDIIGIVKRPVVRASDHMHCYQGQFLAIEVKRPTARYTSSLDQKAFALLVKESGGIAIVATSVQDVIDAGL